MLLPRLPDPALNRWRLRIGIAGTILLIAYMAALPLLVSEQGVRQNDQIAGKAAPASRIHPGRATPPK
jgi:hypothetical protein